MVRNSPRVLGLPIATYPGLALTGATVKDVVTSAQAQVQAQIALQQRYHSPFVLSAMDLSAEAEAFGCELYLSDHEIPSVIGRRVASLEQAQQLPIPQAGDKRTAVYLEAVRGLKALPGRPKVFAGCIGPFSLAARIVGVSEAMELTLTEPDLVATVLEKSTTFLTAYARAFKAAGADGLIMAEPTAGLLSPRGMASNSSAYIRRIAEAVSGPDFVIILHNCAAKVLHLPAVLESGLDTFHFGAPMDIPGALEKLPGNVVVCGNLDPAGVFCQMTPDEVTAKARNLLKSVETRKNFVLSSGCDVPPNASLANVDAFYLALKD